MNKKKTLKCDTYHAIVQTLKMDFKVLGNANKKERVVFKKNKGPILMWLDHLLY